MAGRRGVRYMWDSEWGVECGRRGWSREWGLAVEVRRCGIGSRVGGVGDLADLAR